jgi:hypothetical protein
LQDDEDVKGGRDNRRGSPYIKGMRVPLMILSALGAGLVAGRKLLGKEITGRKNKAIESAVQEARHRIRADTMMFVARSFRTFAIATGIKLACPGRSLPR